MDSGSQPGGADSQTERMEIERETSKTSDRDTSQSSLAATKAILPGLTTDNQFHALKYHLCWTYVRVVDSIAGLRIPQFSDVMDLHNDLLAVESAAPAWLRWSEDEGGMPDVGMDDNPMVRDRMLTQQHLGAIHLHKAIASKSIL